MQLLEVKHVVLDDRNLNIIMILILTTKSQFFYNFLRKFITPY